MRAASSLLDVVVPRRCAACGGGEQDVCAPCLAALPRLRSPLCARCGAPTAWPVERCAECARRRLAFRTARAAVAYEGSARALVAAWKEGGRRSLTAALAVVTAEVVPCPHADLVTAVPGDQERTLWRGHNSADALARELAARWELPCAQLLARPERRRRQRGLAARERRANVQNSFVARGSAGGRVALVDDVYTTGATVAAAASELRRAGARSVDVVTFARAVRR